VLLAYIVTYGAGLFFVWLDIVRKTGIGISLPLMPKLLRFGFPLVFSMLRRVFSTDMALHAICVVAIFLFSCLFEPRLGVRLIPIQPLFFFYLLTLDRKKHFLRS